MSSDMTGIYRSVTGGRTWQLQDGREVSGYHRFSAAFSPVQPGQLLAAHPTRGLRLGVPGSSSPAEMNWTPFSPPLVVNGNPVDLHSFANAPTAAAYSANGSGVLFGTRTGLYVLRNGTWSRAATATDPSGAVVPIGDVVAVQWAPTDLAFAADLDRVLWSADAGATWHVLEQAGPGGLPPRPASTGYDSRRIRALVGARDPRAPGTFVVYAALSRGGQPATAGIYRCEVTTGTPTAAPPPWVPMLTSATLRYERLAAPADNADVLHAGVADDPSYWTVHRGNYQSNTTPPSMTSVPTFNGYSNRPTEHNVVPGWIDEAEQPASLGFGFGGPANGLCCDRATGATVAYVNAAFADVSVNATGPVTTWQQAYTHPVPTPSGRRWRTNGSDDTTVWHYYVHPQNGQLHFLANTDICLSRSEDAGDTWQLVAPRTRGFRWGNFYELAIADGAIYAAVSTEHDLPYDKQFRNRNPAGAPGHGAVLVSTDAGATWAEHGAQLPDLPVTSVIYGGTPAALYAAVFGDGVYQLAGATWSRLGNLPLPWAYQLGFDAADRLLCLVSRGNTNDPVGAGLYRWNGTSWLDLSAAVASSYGSGTTGSRYFHPVSFTPHPTAADTLWLSTLAVGGGPSGAVWVTDSASAAQPAWTQRLNWTMLAAAGSSLEGWLSAFSVAFDPSDTTANTVYAATFTHGVWVTTNAGAGTPNWLEFRPIPFVRSQRVMFPPTDPGTVYITTFGAGAWRTMSAAHAARWQQQIRRRAYDRYRARAGGPGTPVNDWVGAERELLHQAINARAYALYEARGRAPGRAVEDWLEAEASIIRTIAMGRLPRR